MRKLALLIPSLRRKLLTCRRSVRECVRRGWDLTRRRFVCRLDALTDLVDIILTSSRGPVPSSDVGSESLPSVPLTA